MCPGKREPRTSNDTVDLADIGSHWADLIQHVTGQRIVRVFTDLHTLVPQRKRPAAATQTFGGSIQSDQSEDVDITTEDYAAIIFETEQGARGNFTVSQVSAGHKNKLSFEVNGSRASARWDADAPNELWLGFRDKANELLLKDPSLVAAEVKAYTHLPGGHDEAWPDALKNVMAEIYTTMLADRTEPAPTHAFASFQDGHRAALLVEAVLASARRSTWVDVQK